MGCIYRTIPRGGASTEQIRPADIQQIQNRKRAHLKNKRTHRIGDEEEKNIRRRRGRTNLRPATTTNSGGDEDKQAMHNACTGAGGEERSPEGVACRSSALTTSATNCSPPLRPTPPLHKEQQRRQTREAAQLHTSKSPTKTAQLCHAMEAHAAAGQNEAKPTSRTNRGASPIRRWSSRLSSNLVPSRMRTSKSACCFGCEM